MNVRWYTPKTKPSVHTERNIETMLKLEEEFLKQRSWAEYLADWVAKFAGSLTFISLHVLGIAAWVLINIGAFKPGLNPFDPYPFSLLAGLISFESVMLAAFVLIKQNRLGYRADHRSHLDLQVNLLAEQEATKILQVLMRMSQHMGLTEGEHEEAETDALATNTPLEEIARDLDRKLRSGESEGK